jgi:WD40 repeat protein
VAGNRDGEFYLSQEVSAGHDAYVAGRDIIIFWSGADARRVPSVLQTILNSLESPYKGLDAFGSMDEPLFFGRDSQAEEILRRVSARPGPLIVSGGSGVGKSSLLRAGVLPLFDGASVVITPTAGPLNELARAAAALTGAGAASIRRELAEKPESLALTLMDVATRRPDGSTRTTLDTTSHPEPGTDRLLLVVDQFEEIFTQCADEIERQGFVTALHAAATTPFGPDRLPAARVVLVVRADFEARTASFEPLFDAVQHRHLVSPMTDTQLRLAISRPAGLKGVAVDEDLVDELVREVGSRARARMPSDPRSSTVVTPAPLPLLSYALDQAWRNRAGQERLTLADYERIGRIEGSVAASAERAFASLTPDQQTAAKHIFIRLTSIGGDGTVSATLATRTSVVSGIAPGDAEAILEAFAGPKARLIMLGRDYVEISHEALLTAWGRLAGWLDGDTDVWHSYIRLHADAREWDGRNRAASYLYSAGRLAEVQETAKRWAAAPERYPPLDEVAAAFLKAVRRATLLGRIVRRVAIAALLALAVVAGAATGATRHFAVEAGQQHAIALSQQLAAESLSLDPTNPDAAGELALAAWRVSPTAQAGDAMMTMLTEQESDGELPGSGVDLEDGASLGVYGITVSPDGKLLASVDYDGYIRVWCLATDTLVTEPWQAAQGTASSTSHSWELVFSPNDQLLASADGDGEVQVWKVASGRPLGQPLRTGTPGGPSTLAFSPDGAQLAIAAQRQVWLWTTSSRALTAMSPPRSITDGTSGSVTGVVFASGNLMASVESSGYLRVWDTATGMATGGSFLVGSANTVTSTAFSPSGNQLASFSGARGDIQLWTPATGRHVQVAAPHGDDVSWVTFSRDGKLLAATTGTTAGIWSTATGKSTDRPLTAGLAANAAALAFFPDGQEVASADGSDGYIHFWTTATGQPVRGTASFSSPSVLSGPFAISTDGKLLAIQGDNGSVQLWDTATDSRIGRLVGASTSSDDKFAFSPDGDELAIADPSGNVHLWDIAAGTLVAATHFPPQEELTPVTSMAFSPNGRSMAIGDGSVVYGWDIQSGKSIRIPLPLSIGGQVAETDVDAPTYGVAPAQAPPDTAIAVAFSPNGKLLETADSYGHIQVFDAATGRSSSTVAASTAPELDGQIGAATFSSDGRLIAGIDLNGNLRIWNAVTEAPVGGPLPSVPAKVKAEDLSLGADDKVLAGVFADGYIRIWSTATGALVGLADLNFSLGSAANSAKGGPGYVVTYSSDGRLMAVSAGDTTQIWQAYPITDPYATLCAEVGPPPGSLWAQYAAGESQPNACVGLPRAPHELH